MTTRGKVIGGVVVVVALAAIGSAAGNKAPTPAGGQQGGGQQVVASRAPAGPVTLLQLSGSGIKNSQEFTATAAWTLAYTYDCSNFGTDGNFAVTTYSGTTLKGVAVNELGSKGSSTTNEYDTGSIHLEMNSECTWTVKVTQP